MVIKCFVNTVKSLFEHSYLRVCASCLSLKLVVNCMTKNTVKQIG